MDFQSSTKGAERRDFAESEENAKPSFSALWVRFS